MLFFIRRLLALIIVFAALTIIAISAIYLFLAPDLPDTTTLNDTQLQVPLRIFSAEGSLMAEFGEKRRIPLQHAEIPEQLIQAVLASEDARFFEHHGVDYKGLLRAVYSLATTGVKAQGGSTITMQVARNFFLTREKTYLRKLNEIILSLQIEQSLSKSQILTLYLNKIYLGNRAYGVGAAANVYYGKSIQELNLPQFAMIAGLPKAPSAFNPIANPDRALLRRDYVLRRMWEVDYISQQDYLTAIQAPITASYHSRDIEVYAPYVAEIIRTQLIEQYGEDVYDIGLNVYTTIRAKHQQAANKALQSALLAYDQRHGYRGVLDRVAFDETPNQETFEQALTAFDTIGPLSPGIVSAVDVSMAEVYIKSSGIIEVKLASMTWAGKQLSTNSRGKSPRKVSDVLAVGDIIHLTQDKDGQWSLAQLPQVEGALIAVSPHDGAITALNGGFEYFQNKFNRVTQSRRQPGSGFKPFIYSAALENGYTPASIINDAPVVLDDASLENEWRPQNYSQKFYGPTRLRVGLIHSRNLVSIRLLRDITPDYAIEYAGQFGFDTKQMPHNLSLALGSGSASPWDMARAYSAMANGGYRIEPYVIQRIEDSDSKILMQAQPATVCETCITTSDDPEREVPTNDSLAPKSAERIMTPQNNYIMNSMLRDVIRYGTGRKALTLGRNDLAGKTGTTNNQVDAWFNGFHPELVAISWVGFDSPRTLGHYETGGQAALPMWIDFMRLALDGVPEAPLREPVGMITVKIAPYTGLLASPNSTDAIDETFRTENVPTKMSRPSNFVSNDDTQKSPSSADLF
jgi:penicillin-binding protein 1A